MDAAACDYIDCKLTALTAEHPAPDVLCRLGYRWDMQLQCLCLTDESPADHRHHTKQLKLVPFLPAVVTCTLALLVLLEPSLLLSTSDIFMLYGCEDPLVGTAPLVSESPTARTLKVHLSCVGHTAHVSAPEVTLQMLNNSSRVAAVGTPSCRILRVGDDRLLSK